ncbi:hypothetical protein BKA67DRAFT_540235 [Truncatella angustata]|uniref:histidine kinase n=1 Tax=Truncatella angustata TaxID=152316 RepID=A0A9P8RNJ9_9PEZI|nr:uncharacterized protein BKA67DRAFT_540235 [Truncatella angustata]KAH6646740.1 hypothetical protein BKA67DRAFT_540235 [Truncatella angustata]
MSYTKAVRNVSEPVRERETFKYDPTLIDDVKFNETGNPLPGEQLFTAEDAVLTCLAQLGACRTRTGRSLVSLFDQRWQYIVAEATPSLPLLSGVNQDHLQGENLWLSGTAIPRGHGVCNHSLVDPGSEDDPDSELPLTLSADLTSDPRFCKSPFCAPGSLARFYAAVPIRTSGGINIGVYCVLHDEPRPTSTWTDTDTEILRSISRSIMSHLEYRSKRDSHQKSERMTRGIISFMEAITSESISPSVPRFGFAQKQPKDENSSTPVLSTLQGGQCPVDIEFTTAPPSDSITQGGAAIPSMVQTLDRDDESRMGGKRPELRSHVSHASSSSSKQSLQQDSQSDSHTATRRILTRAANELREAIDTDGVVFVDASATSFGALAESSPSRENTSADAATNSNCKDSDVISPILGFSTPKSRRRNVISNLAKNVQIPAKILYTLFRRYPTGAIFTYDENGALQHCDSSEDTEHSRQSQTDSTICHRYTEAQTLSKFFPGARSVVFVPIRDDQKERWFAGGFSYTLTPTHIMSKSGELSYLRAFSTLVMAAVHRTHITFAHKAKSDVLNSLSHELRSPLHGVIVSTELLADTSLDVFQGNVLHTLETCGRTLLDTIDHLLDFSNISNYLNAVEAEKRSRGNLKNKTTSIETGMKSLYGDISLDHLVEEVTESVFAGHCFQHMSVAQLARRDNQHADARANSQADFSRATADMVLFQHDDGLSQLPLANVSIYLNLDANVSSYRFFSMAGAISRIVMNLLGNALKYTQKGTICVSLAIDPESKKTLHNGQKMVRLTVADTGMGMSHEFLQNELYKPFRQADQLSPGIGLGLSLVKKIVSSLAGSISIESELNVGTVATVLLPLLPTSLSATEDPTEQFERGELISHRQGLEGLRIRLIGFDTSKGIAGSVPAGKDLPIKEICRDWLHMEIISQSQSNRILPDLVLCSDTALEKSHHITALSTGLPVVVVCANALAAYRMSARNKAATSTSICEFISQPVGPLKLTRILSHTFRRWADRQDFTASFATTSLRPDYDVLSETPSPLCTAATTLRSSSVQSPVTDGTNLSEWLPNTATASATSQTSETNPSSSKVPSSLASTTSVPTDNDIGKTTTAASEENLSEFLLVDDNPINLRILCMFMKKLGRNYITAVDGQDAVDKFKQYPGSFKYVFIDISMPRLNGMEATRQIRAFERDQHLDSAAVFALSGLASADVQQEAFSSGIDLFLTKPVKLKELSLILTNMGESIPTGQTKQ